MVIADVKLTPVSHPAPTTLRWGRGARDAVGGIIVQPDCARCGGITELRRIAALSSTWGLSCMPDVGCGCGYDIRVVATAHVPASISNGMYLCYPAYDTPLRSELLADPPVVTDSYLRPGLRPSCASSVVS